MNTVIPVIKQIDQTEDSTRATSEAEEIFFSSSTVQSFADAHARSLFRHKWFGVYLEAFRNDFYVAQMADKTVGYLAGCRADPLTDARLVEHNYYQVFRDVLPAYPAHLHVNVGEAYRSAGIGAALIEVFAAQCAAEGLSGLHVVTGQGARNLPFYHRAGFIHDVRPHDPNSGQLFLGRRLPADQG